MTGLEVVVLLDKWLKGKAETNMTAYMDTKNKEYLGASRAFAETKIHIQNIIKGEQNEH